MESYEHVVKAYTDYPTGNGDVLILTDDKIVQEVTGLADQWDPVLRRNIAEVLREVGVSEVALLVARPEGIPLPQDHAMWADLRDELQGSAIVVHPLEGLPAAA